MIKQFLYTLIAASIYVTAGAKIENVIFILSDDHRYDFMGFMEEAPDFLETPHLDRMAKEGAHLKMLL